MKLLQIIAFLSLLALLLSIGATILAQTNGYSLAQWSTSAAIHTGIGQNYTSISIAGQPIANNNASGETYSLTDGFIPSDTQDGNTSIYLPSIQR